MTRKLWTIEEDEFLRENYTELGATECSIILDRTFTSVSHRAIKFGLKSSKTNRSKNWSDLEREILTKNYSKYGLEYCVELLPNRTPNSIYSEASKLKLKNYNIKNSTPTWTHKEYEQALCEREVDAYPIDQYINSRTTILHGCVEGHSWKAKPSNILSGTGCPTCSKSGFNTGKAATLYYIKIITNEDTFYKIGITNRTISERFDQDKDKTIVVLLEKCFSEGIEAKVEERTILDKFKDKRICVPNLLRSKGNTELFKEDVLQLDRD